MSYILFDSSRNQLLPFTHTRPVADIRCGIMTMRERWELLLGATTSTLTVPYLQNVFPRQAEGAEDAVTYINGSVFATAGLATAIKGLKAGGQIVKGDIIIAVCGQSFPADNLTSQEYEGELQSLVHVWDIFSMNGRAIKADYDLLTRDRNSAPIPENVVVSNPEKLFLEPGAVIRPGCIINNSNGPVYVGKDAEVMEGCIIRGPLAVGEHAVLKMGAKVYGDTTIGPGCKVGGEVSNVVFFANSNKGHDGFLGNAVIGEWCNLGADTNASNLKNNYDEVKIWDETQNKLVKTGLTFIGLIMGDHSKCGINTMFNTGTVVGVSCNIFGGSFPEKFIPSFSWGGSDVMSTYEFTKAMETAIRMMQRRGKTLSDAETAMYQYIFEQTAQQRVAFNN